MSSLIYLASPYSHPDKSVMRLRYEEAQRFTAHRMKEGVLIFSPIAYGHHIAQNYILPTDAEYWREFNESIIRACSTMWVLQLPGWQDSKGVSMEIAYAVALDILVEFKDP